jgi:hypothetical protein
MHQLKRGECAISIPTQQQILSMPAFFGNSNFGGRTTVPTTAPSSAGSLAVAVVRDGAQRRPTTATTAISFSSRTANGAQYGNGPSGRNSASSAVAFRARVSM